MAMKAHFCHQPGTVPLGISAQRQLGKNVWNHKKRGKNRKIPHSSQVIFDLGSDKALTLYQCTTEPLTKYVEQKKSSGIT